MAAEVHGFQAEVAKLLGLLANSLYSNKEIFLRELISNASDALDKLRFEALSDQSLLGSDPTPRIRVRADREAGTLTVSDNGIGLTLEEANGHLGTIARSGTEEFMRGLTGDQERDALLIGRFGVGFYSAFIVADRVTVLSRSAHAAPAEAVRWESDGAGTFTSELITREERGTDIVLHLKESELRFLDDWVLRGAITKYSDHISVPVFLWEKQPEAAEEKKEGEAKEPAQPRFDWVQVNDAKALWTLSPREVKPEQYQEFYRHLTHGWDEPLTSAHNRVEGELDYISLLYVPGEAPWDLYDRDSHHGLKLFVRRVFIMDEAEQFLPRYLRFVRGLVDSDDLPLNVSREMLQDSPITEKLRKALTHRVLGMLSKLAADEPEKYAKFWSLFGRVLKEGPIEDAAARDSVLPLLRFASTKGDGQTQSVSLDDYLKRAVKGQDKIYYLIAASYKNAATSPYLEEFRKKGIEVLLMWERIDEWLMGGTREYQGHRFISVTAADLELGELSDKVDDKEKSADDEKNAPLLTRLKTALGNQVSEVRASSRLTDSPSCVVAEQGAFVSPQLRQMFAAMGQETPQPRYILEVNLAHPLLARAAAVGDDAVFARWARILLDQAVLREQGALADPNAFVAELNALLSA